MPDTTITEPTTPAGPEWVERSGVIFRFGDYPDRDFSLTPEEYAEANQDISEIPIDLSHTPTILDGSLGHLFAAEVKGDELHGSVRLPRWLDALLDAGKRKVSCEWDRATKRLRKLSLVPEPRIPEAVLLSAFSADHPGDSAAAFAAPMEIQSLVFSKDKFSKAEVVKWCKDHDFKTEVDETDDSYRMRQVDPGVFEEGSFRTKALTDGIKAVMGKKKSKAAMSADDDLSDPAAALGGLVAAFTARQRHPTLNVAMQHVHDLMALYPGGCPKSEAVAAFGDQTKQRKAVRAFHDAALEHGAACPGRTKATYGASGSGRPKVSLKEKLGRVLFGAGATEIELAPDITDDQAQAALAVLTGGKAETKVADPPPPPAVVSFADTPEGKAALAEIKQLKDAAETQRLAVQKERAALFAHQAVAAGHVTPVLEADLTALFAQALEDDHQKAATVTFSAGSQPKTGGRLDAMAAFVASLPKHNLTAELIDPNGQLKAGAEVLFNRGNPPDPNAPMTTERREYLLSQSALGRDVLRKEQQARKGAGVNGAA